MQIGDFYVVTETKDEDDFVNDNIELLLDISLRQRTKISAKEYSVIITNLFNEWRKDGDF